MATEVWFKPYETQWSCIGEVDFTWIKKKLMDLEEGEGWSEDYTQDVLEEYKKFLLLTKINGDIPIVPSKAVDTAWHYHILDTQAYVVDCEKVFGRFLHHFPYWGMRGDDDAKDLQDAFARTLEIYEKTIGPVPSQLWKCAGRCPNCGVGSCFGGETLVEMADGSHKCIQNLKIGDVTAGGKVTGVMQYDGSSVQLFSYNGVLVTGSHAVFEDQVWKRVHDSRLAIRSSKVLDTIYCVRVSEHRIYSGGSCFVDEMEVDGIAMNVIHLISLAELNKETKRTARQQVAPAVVHTP